MALVVLAVVSVGMAALSVRVLNAASAAAAKPLPAADLQSLAAYLGPLPDSTRLAGTENGTMVGDQDPFGGSTPAPAAAPVRNPGSRGVRPQAVAGQQWIVSSILFENARRSAIVNNAWVSVGDRLDGGARVTAIERKHIVVTDTNGIRHVVPIQGGAQ